ncbi:hypothetical protein ACN47E_008281 [Coniothyrium glycines]
MRFQATAILAFASSVAAHMTINYPVPYGKDTLNSSPLEAGDFPCKQRAGVYDVTEMNQWNAGETKEVSFKGSAVHGGGSCQFSITTDMEPTEQSQWKVITSAIGGCPSNVTGNLPEDPNGNGAATFPVTMPDNIPDGTYTFAWTWLNKVGNREFYMNCAPLQVGSGSGQGSTASASEALSALPDMFVANLPATECTTSEGQDFNYPNPGQTIVKGAGAALGNTVSGSGCAAQAKLGAGNGQIGTPAQGTQPAASAPAATSAPATAPSYGSPVQSAIPSNPGGVFAPGASSAPVAEKPTAAQPTPAQPTAVKPTFPAAAQPIASEPTYGKGPDNSNNNNNGSTPSIPSGDCTPCTNDGAVVCIGTKQFGLCNRGCAVPQDLAAGMSCSAGTVVGTASLKTKRSLKFPRAHLHRRHGSRFL